MSKTGVSVSRRGFCLDFFNTASNAKSGRQTCIRLQNLLNEDNLECLMPGTVQELLIMALGSSARHVSFVNVSPRSDNLDLKFEGISQSNETTFVKVLDLCNLCRSNQTITTEMSQYWLVTAEYVEAAGSQNSYWWIKVTTLATSGAFYATQSIHCMQTVSASKFHWMLWPLPRTMLCLISRLTRCLTQTSREQYNVGQI